MENNPIRFIDPTGHSVQCDPYEDDCHHGEPPTAPPPSDPGGGASGNRCNNDPDCKLRGPEEQESDTPIWTWRLGNENCDSGCQDVIGLLFIEGLIMDSMATGINLAFFIGYNTLKFINPKLGLAVLIAFQKFSVIPNLIGSAGALAWIASGFLSGENYLQITRTSSAYQVSGSIAQDTIATMIFDGGGWIAPYAQNPNGAFINSGLGVIYDLTRNPFDPILPTKIQPTFSFTIDIN